MEKRKRKHGGFSHFLSTRSSLSCSEPEKGLLLELSLGIPQFSLLDFFDVLNSGFRILEGEKNVQICWNSDLPQSAS